MQSNLLKEELFSFSVSTVTWKIQEIFADKWTNEQMIPIQEEN